MTSFISNKNNGLAKHFYVETNKLSLEEKLKILENYFANDDSELSPIPEEGEGEEIFEDDNVFFNHNDIGELYQHQTSETTSQSDVLSSSLPHLFPHNNIINSSTISHPNLSRNLSTYNMLYSSSSNQNKSLPVKILHRTLSLSSLLDVPKKFSINNNQFHPPICLSSSNQSTQSNQLNTSSISLAASALDLVSLSHRNSTKSSRSNLNSSLVNCKSYYFSQLSLNTASNSLLRKINESNQSHPIINKIKTRIKSHTKNQSFNSVTKSPSYVNHLLYRNRYQHQSNLTYSPSSQTKLLSSSSLLKTKSKMPKVILNHSFQFT